MDEASQSEPLTVLERQVYRLADLPADIADAIERSEMDAAHEPLDTLLK